MTWYPQDYLYKAPMTNMAMRANLASRYPGRTYRFCVGSMILLFRHELSDTQPGHHPAGPPLPLEAGNGQLQGRGHG